MLIKRRATRISQVTAMNLSRDATRLHVTPRDCGLAHLSQSTIDRISRPEQHLQASFGLAMSAQAPNSEPQASGPMAPSPIPAWRAFAHLYFPALTIIFLTSSVPDPFSHRALLLASAIPTYCLASLVHKPRPRPTERFTRRSDLYRAAVLFTYGRLLGTPFDLLNFVLDFFATYGIGAILDQDEGAPPRRSEFFVHGLLTTASSMVFGFIPPSWTWTWIIMGSIDRAMFRAAYLALVDDVVKVLAYPQVGSKRGKAVVVGVQAVIIAVSVMWAHFIYIAGMREKVEKEFMMPIDL